MREFFKLVCNDDSGVEKFVTAGREYEVSITPDDDFCEVLANDGKPTTLKIDRFELPAALSVRINSSGNEEG